MQLSDGSTIGGEMTLSLLAIRITKVYQCGACKWTNVSKCCSGFARELFCNWGEQALSKYNAPFEVKSTPK